MSPGGIGHGLGKCRNINFMVADVTKGSKVAISTITWIFQDFENLSRIRPSGLCDGSPCNSKDTLAERLRRRPAKPMGSPRVGSNPTGVVSETHLSILPAHMYVPSTVVATSINPILHIHPPPHPSRIHPHPAPTAGSWPRSGGACSASFGFGRGSVSVRLGLGSARLGLGSVRSRCVSVALLSWFGSVSVRLGLVSVRSHLGSGRSLFFLGLFRSRFGSAACDTQRAPTLPHPPSPARSFPKV